MTSIDVVYLAGGEGIRAGLGYPKQFYRLGGKPILVHGLETLRKIDMIGDILIPCADEGYIYKICKDFNIQGIRPVCAGATRQTSVYNGITESLTPFVNNGSRQAFYNRGANKKGYRNGWRSRYSG